MGARFVSGDRIPVSVELVNGELQRIVKMPGPFPFQATGLSSGSYRIVLESCEDFGFFPGENFKGDRNGKRNVV